MAFVDPMISSTPVARHSGWARGGEGGGGDSDGGAGTAGPGRHQGRGEVGQDGTWGKEDLAGTVVGRLVAGTGLGPGRDGNGVGSQVAGIEMALEEGQRWLGWRRGQGRGGRDGGAADVAGEGRGGGGWPGSVGRRRDQGRLARGEARLGGARARWPSEGRERQEGLLGKACSNDRMLYAVFNGPHAH